MNDLLIDDPHILAVPIHDNGESLLEVSDALRAAQCSSHTPLVRMTVLDRLLIANASLARSGCSLQVIEGYRSPARQRQIFETAIAALRAEKPLASVDELRALATTFASPPRTDAPHATGGAVDVVVVDGLGETLDMGSQFDMPWYESEGRAATRATVNGVASAHRAMLTDAMSDAGFVNYPYEWWHWSYGDQYWAWHQGQPTAKYAGVVS